MQTIKRLTLLTLTAISLGASGLAMANTKAGKGGQVLEPPPAGVVTVSDYELNTFAFPAPVKRVYFPANSPVLGTPIYLADNTQVMLQFDKGVDKPVQMVVELEGGKVVQLRVLPRPVPGISHKTAGAGAAQARAASGSTETRAQGAAHAEDVELLKFLVSEGNPPAEFEAVALPGVTRFDKFSVVPLSAWSNGERRIMVFSLVAVPGQVAVVSPPQFYRPGITAVLVDGDTVDESTSPQLYVVDEVADE